MPKDIHRITYETIRAGQPQAYADTEHVVRVTFEHVPHNSTTDNLVPMWMDEGSAREHYLKRVPGYIAQTRRDNFQKLGSLEGHFASYLDYVKPIGPRKASAIIPGGDPNQMVSYIWE